MPNNSVLSMDGNWVYKFTSKFFVFDVIDVDKKKIIAFVYLDKYKKSKYKNYAGASNMMEACHFKQIMPKLRQTNKIRSIVKVLL